MYSSAVQSLKVLLLILIFIAYLFKVFLLFPTHATPDFLQVRLWMSIRTPWNIKHLGGMPPQLQMTGSDLAQSPTRVSFLLYQNQAWESHQHCAEAPLKLPEKSTNRPCSLVSVAAVFEAVTFLHPLACLWQKLRPINKGMEATKGWKHPCRRDARR